MACIWLADQWQFLVTFTREGRDQEISLFEMGGAPGLGDIFETSADFGFYGWIEADPAH